MGYQGIKMKRGELFLLLFSIINVVTCPSIGFSLQEDTHMAINEEVAQKTIMNFSLSNYLINSLEFRERYN